MRGRALQAPSTSRTSRAAFERSSLKMLFSCRLRRRACPRRAPMPAAAAVLALSPGYRSAMCRCHRHVVSCVPSRAPTWAVPFRAGGLETARVPRRARGGSWTASAAGGLRAGGSRESEVQAGDKTLQGITAATGRRALTRPRGLFAVGPRRGWTGTRPRARAASSFLASRSRFPFCDGLPCHTSRREAPSQLFATAQRELADSTAQRGCLLRLFSTNLLNHLDATHAPPGFAQGGVSVRAPPPPRANTRGGGPWCTLCCA